MKQFFTLLALLIAFTIDSNAQDSTLVCVPDSAFLASGQIIYPAPFVNDTLGDGIPEIACVNTPYDLTFFVNVPDMIVFPGVPFPITVEYISIDSVQNLPSGVTYSCGVDDCFIPGDSVTCIYLQGTPDETNQPGDYELKIFLSLKAVGLPAFEASFPDPVLAPGTYIMTLNEEGSADCGTTPVFDYQDVPDGINLYPNPVSSSVTLEWESKQAGKGVLQVMSYTGQLLFERNISFGQGLVNQSIQVNNLQAGMYLVGIQATDTHFWTKMIKE